MHLSYRSYCSRENFKDESIEIDNFATRQCYFCDKYFTNFAEFKKHVKCCSKITGIVYKFKNKNIVNFQNSFEYMGDLPFVVYSDYKTTTDDNVFNDKKCL